MMNYKELLNSAAKWGLVLGFVMGISRIFEASLIISGELSKYTLLSFEWIAIAFVYVTILYRANKSRANSADSKLGYSFTQSLNYTILISIFAAVIVGISSHIYTVNYVGGYDIYLEQSVASIVSILEQSGTSNDAVSEMLKQSRATIETMRETPPSILTTIFSSISSYIISGFCVGLIIAAMTKRRAEVEVDAKNEMCDEQKDIKDE